LDRIGARSRFSGFAHVRVGKPAPAFPGHALENHLVGAGGEIRAAKALRLDIKRSFGSAMVIVAIASSARRRPQP
jgi:hypothetical protein